MHIYMCKCHLRPPSAAHEDLTASSHNGGGEKVTGFSDVRSVAFVTVRLSSHS